jgi:predicted acylesterase/phospholipase RssA
MNLQLLDSIRGKKIGLVLSGGVVRAAGWHLGVGLALEELGFKFGSIHTDTVDKDSLLINTYVGSSAGSIISAFFVNGFGPQQVIDSHLGKNDELKAVGYKDMLYVLRPKLKAKRPIQLQKDFNPLKNLPFLLKKTFLPLLNTSGLFSTEGLKKYLNKNVLKSNNFNDYASDFFVIGTQLDSSQKVIFSKFNKPVTTKTDRYYVDIDISDAIAASMSIPPFYSPFPIHNKVTDEINYFIDGEIRDTLSSHVAIENGCEVIISSWTHTPYHYQEEIGSLANYGIPTIATQAIFLMIQKKIMAARQRHHQAIDAIREVDAFLRKEKFSKRKDIIKILENKLEAKSNLTFIDIYPANDDYKTFFTNLFSLDKEVMSQVIRQAYKRTFKAFNND